MPGHGAEPAGGRDGSRAKLKNAGFFAGHEARGGVRKTCQVFRAHGNGNPEPDDYVVSRAAEASLLRETRSRQIALDIGRKREELSPRMTSRLGGTAEPFRRNSPRAIVR